MAAPHWCENVRGGYGEVGDVFAQKRASVCHAGTAFCLFFSTGLKARTRGRGCSVSTSFHTGLNDADHSWQLTQPTCRASSILKITQSPLSVHQPPAVSGLSKNKFILQSLSFSFVLFQQRQVTQHQHKPTPTPLSTASGRGLVFLGHHTPRWHHQHHHPAPSLYSWAPKLFPHPFFFPFTSPSLSLAQQWKFWGVRASGESELKNNGLFGFFSLCFSKQTILNFCCK